MAMAETGNLKIFHVKILWVSGTHKFFNMLLSPQRASLARMVEQRTCCVCGSYVCHDINYVLGAVLVCEKQPWNEYRRVAVKRVVELNSDHAYTIRTCSGVFL